MSSRSRRAPFKVANAASLLVAMLVTSIVLGITAAGLLIPAVAMMGAASTGAVNMFSNLDGNLALNPLAVQSRILASDGTLLIAPADENRKVVESDAISPWMKKAQVAIEDKRFYDHGGMDFMGLARAFVRNQSGTSTQGGSTLTQQFVKLVLIENARRNQDAEEMAKLEARSGRDGYVRKLRELRYAVQLEKRYSKDEILTAYLNMAYYGDRAFGVEAAAQHYFSKPAKRLNIQESALLAGIVQMPGKTDPINYKKAALERRNTVLMVMHQEKMITDQQYEAAKNSPIRLKVSNPNLSCAGSKYPYACEYVMAWLLEQPALGKDREERRNTLYRDGLTVRTSIDPKLMDIIQEELVKKVPVGNDARVGAAGVIVEPGTGRVLAMGQNTKYSTQERWGQQALNWSVEQKYGGGLGFLIGSTAKLFTILTALESGYSPDSTITVRPADKELPVPPGAKKKDFKVAEFTGADFPLTPCGSGLGEEIWYVRNSSSSNDEGGTWPFRRIVAQSINTAFAELASQLDLCEVQKNMTELGMHHSYNDPKSGAQITARPASLVLGADNVDPLTLTNAYATAGANGMYCEPRPVDKITYANGKELNLKLPECTQAIDPVINADLVELFRSPLQRGGSAYNSPLAGGRDAAGKTGTTDMAQQTWFVGFTPQMAGGVWVGIPKATESDGLIDIKIGDTYYPGAIHGSDLAAPIWKQIMDRAHEGLPEERFPTPGRTQQSGVAEVPDVKGMPLAEAARALRKAGFVAEVRDSVDSYSTKKGAVVSQRPSAGSRQQRGTSVRLYPSSGYAPGTRPTPTASSPTADGQPTGTTTVTATPTVTTTKPPATEPPTTPTATGNGNGKPRKKN